MTRILWVATGLAEHLTGIERVVINTIANTPVTDHDEHLVLVDENVDWAVSLEPHAEVLRLRRRTGGVARAPRLPDAYHRLPIALAHSFGAVFPVGLTSAAPRSYTVHDWGPFFDRAMTPTARAAWSYAITQGIRSSGLVHFLAQATAEEAPLWLRPMLDRKTVVTGLPYPVHTAGGPRVGSRVPGLVLSVGTNVPRKRFALLSDACRMVPGAHLVVAGQGTERFSVCAEPGNTARVVGRGRVSDAELHDLYGTAALFVLASTYEGFGLPVLEAWEAGCVILVTESVASRLPYEIRRDVLTVPTSLTAAQLSLAIASALGRTGNEAPRQLDQQVTLIDHLLVRAHRENGG